MLAGQSSYSLNFIFQTAFIYQQARFNCYGFFISRHFCCLLNVFFKMGGYTMGLISFFAGVCYRYIAACAVAVIGGMQLPLAARVLQAGTLVPVLPAYRLPDRFLYAVYPDARFIPQRVRSIITVIEHLLPEMTGPLRIL